MTVARPASPDVHARPASTSTHRPRGERTAIASPCPTSIRCSSTAPRSPPSAPRGPSGIQTRIARAPMHVRSGRTQRRDHPAVRSAIAAEPATSAANAVGATVRLAPGTLAAIAATPSIARSNGLAASATKSATMPAPATFGTTIARKSVGWSSKMIGPAARLLSGAIRLTRPKCHATSGAVTTVVRHPAISSRASVARQPRHCSGSRRPRRPATMIPAYPATESCQPRSSAVRGSCNGTSAPSANVPHGETGR